MDLVGKSFGVVGASNNPNKFGYKIVRTLKRISVEVYPINPKKTQILGLVCFSEPQKINKQLDVLVFVVPPKITLEVIKKNFLKANFFWFQPNSFDEKVINFCEENGLNYEAQKCIINEIEKKFS